jgi:predicted lysophospholipase L1 biosynthesis ABC-type transport system permease subunit
MVPIDLEVPPRSAIDVPPARGPQASGQESMLRRVISVGAAYPLRGPCDLSSSNTQLDTVTLRHSERS